MRHLESLEAQALIQWWTLEANRRKIDPRLLFHIPNGGLRHKAVAMKLKAEGVRAGIPDYFLAIPLRGKGGLWIELKALNGRVSASQGEMLEVLKREDYDVSICHGWQEAKQAIEGYLGSV